MSQTGTRIEKLNLPKRFYQDVTLRHEGKNAELLLDGKPVRTPGKRPLLLPRAVAEVVADEWRMQGERLDPETMPLTKIANSVIDGVIGHEAGMIEGILAYAAADLLCYRAEAPEGLVALQKKHWDPVLAWARDALGARLVQAEGVMHVEQPEASLEALRRAIDGSDPFALAALHIMAALTGSALLALAVARGRLTPEAAFEAAHADEDWQISQWGEDVEAAERRERRRREFDAAARVFALTRAE